MKLFSLTIIVLLSLLVCNAQNSKPETLTNKMVVDLVKAQFSADTIIKKIQTAASVNFDTGTEDLIKLKNSGVEEKIIRAMLDRDTSTSPVRSSSPPTGVIDGTNSQEKEKPKKFSVKEKFFTFDLKACKNSGGDIVCELMITNNDNSSRGIQFGYTHYRSFMIDDKGNEYKASDNKIANREDSGMMLLGNGLTVRARVVFDNVPSDTASIKSLTLWFNSQSGVIDYAGNNRPFKVEFRDLPLMQ